VAIKRRDVYLSGPPGSGKSTLVARAVELAVNLGCRVAGFYAPEVRGRTGERIGFDIVDVSSGRSWCLARKGVPGTVRVGSYTVCTDQASEAAGVLRGLIGSADYIVLDEIGPMELKVPELRQLILEILGLNKPVTGVVHRKLKTSHPNIYAIIARRGLILWVTRENRESIGKRYLQLVEAIAVEACTGKGG